MFFQQEITHEVHERLAEVNKSFTQPVVITPFPALWQGFAPTVPEGPHLKLAQAAHDLVIHALCLHWADDPVGQLIQCRRALCPDGLFIGALFGGHTLHELRMCLAEAEVEVTGGLSPRILPMAEIRDVGGLLQRAHFTLPVADSFRKIIRYKSAYHLMRDLRAMGEGNAMHARLRRPARRAIFAKAAEMYAARFADDEGYIPATFEVIFLTGWAAHESQPKPLRPASARARLADALGTKELILPPDSR